jgi:hypothetical protein
VQFPPVEEALVYLFPDSANIYREGYGDRTGYILRFVVPAKGCCEEDDDKGDGSKLQRCQSKVLGSAQDTIEQEPNRLTHCDKSASSSSAAAHSPPSRS